MDFGIINVERLLHPPKHLAPMLLTSGNETFVNALHLKNTSSPNSLILSGIKISHRLVHS